MIFKKSTMKTIALVAAICSLTTSMSQASIVFSVDLDPSQPGIQNTLTVAQGADFQAAIVMELTDSTSCNLYGVTFSYDSASLIYVAGVELAPHPLFTNMLLPLSLSMTPSGRNVRGIDAATKDDVDGPNTELSGLVAKFDFTAPSASVSDIHFNLFKGSEDGSYDNNLSEIFPAFNGATLKVSSVPEPSSLGVVLGVGLLAVVLRRRQRPSTAL